MHRYIFLPAVASLAFFVAACVPAVETTQVAVAPGSIPQSTINSVQQKVREMMKDPESAKFRGTRTYRTKYGDQIVCGEYDAKNSYGGYNGYDTYYFRVRNGGVMAKYVDTRSNEYSKPASQACAEAAKGQLPIPSSQVG